MDFSETTYNPPEPLDYYESMVDALRGQVDMAPNLYEAEADEEFGRPAYARLEQKIAKNALLGERKEVDQNGYVVLDDKNFDESKYTQFETEKDAILAKAKELDRSGGLYNKVLNGDDADGTWWENAHNHGFAHGSNAEKDVVGRWNMWRSEHQASTGQQIDAPKHGSNAPYYKKGDTNVTASPEEGIVREYVGIESAGKEVYSGGVTDLIGGRQKTQYFNSDGTQTSRQAGFDVDGEFLGTQKFEQDLRQREQRSTIDNELGLVGEYGQEATNLYRQQGGIQDALDETERLGSMSAIPRNQSNDIFGLVDNPQPTMRQGQQQSDYENAVQDLSNFESDYNQQKQMFGDGYQSNTLDWDKSESWQNMKDDWADKEWEGKLYAYVNDKQKFEESFTKKRNELETIQQNKRTSANQPQMGVGGLIADYLQSKNTRPRSNQPSSKGLNQQMLAQAQEGMQAGGRLTSREMRTASQGARMATSARGRGRDFSGVLAELNFGEQASRARQADRQNFAGQVMNTQMGLMDRAISNKQINDQSYQTGLAQDRGYAVQRVGVEQATSADPFQAILGRPSGVSNQAGQATYGNAYAGVNASPQLYNPAQGAEFTANQQAQVNQYDIAHMNAETSRKNGNKAFAGAVIGAGATAFAGRNG